MKTYYNVVRFFKKNLPPNMPVKVRRVKLSDKLDGDCQHQGKHFLIRINRKFPEYYAIEVFLHEWAHALAWDETKDAHCDEWGKAYSKVYRMFLDNFFKDE